MYDAHARRTIAQCLAGAFLAGAWNERGLVRRGRQALDPRPPWLTHLARETLATYPRAPRDRPRELATFIAQRLATLPRPDDAPEPPRPRRWLLPEQQMGRRRWPTPEIATVGELAERLDLTTNALAWLADTKSLERTVTDERLRHYRYGTLPRAAGTPRLIERPKTRLKQIQRRLLHEILDLVPAHEAAHGFTRGRSAITHAGRHTGQAVVLRFDLEDFFASISAARVYGIFRTAGYPESVSHTLTGLATNVIPVTVWQRVPRPTRPDRIPVHHRLGRRLAAPHLPQGAPTSPALANLAAFGLDRRLTGLARSLGIAYTRYADDLTFSGDQRLLNEAPTLRAALATITTEEGFAINERKTMLVTRAGRQRVCGIVVNAHVNVARRDYDTLKATLHNYARDGAPRPLHAQLQGQIAWVESLHPARGAKLRARLEAIEWR